MTTVKLGKEKLAGGGHDYYIVVLIAPFSKYNQAETLSKYVDEPEEARHWAKELGAEFVDETGESEV